MKRQTRHIVSLVAISTLAGVGFVAAKPALAGTNGQQISICQHGTDYNTVRISGTNQDGTGHGEDFSFDRSQECNTVWGAWWKGRVFLWWVDSASNRESDNTLCIVPDEMPDSDVFRCREEPTVQPVNPPED